ncbi:MAG: hypothetical protein ACLGG0_01390 [Bacteriovoracia bacterium]
MRTLLVAALFLVSFASWANSVAQYRILEGKLHKGGTASVEVLADPVLFKTLMTYDIKKKSWAPIPSSALKGDSQVDLPELFKDERGYLELELKGEMEVDDGLLKYVRRTQWRDLKDAHLVQVFPKNGRSRMDIIYHPTLPGAGWGWIKVVFISSIPLLNGYEAQMELR